MSEHVLVTGGLGFIGSHLCRTLALHGYDVLNLDKHSYAVLPETVEDLWALKNQGCKYQLIVGDVQDGDLLRNIFAQHKPTKVFHLAAESHVDRSIMFPNDFLMSNVVGTYQLLETYRSYIEGVANWSEHALVYCSTDEVYGSLEPDDPSFTLCSPTRPTSPYAATKACGDAICRAWGHTYQIPVITTHCTNNYGPGQFPEKLVPKIITSLIEQEPIPIHGSGYAIRDWLYVMDHVRGLMRAAWHGEPGRTYNFSASDERTNLEIVELVAAEVAKRLNALRGVPIGKLIEHVNIRPTDDPRYSLDSSFARKELNWEPTVTLEQGIEETVRYYFQRHE